MIWGPRYAAPRTMRKHYPKVITACCFLFLFVNIGMPSTSFSVYQPYLVALPGIGDSGGSLILSVRTLVTLLAMFVVNRYYNRLDCRLAVTLGCALTAAGFYLYSFATSMPVFLAGAVCAGLGYGLGGMVGATLLTGRWYKTHLGTAVGIAAVGSGVAGMLLPPVALSVIHGLSLSAAFLMEAVFATAVAAIVFALVRNQPSDLGMRAHGEEQMEFATKVVKEQAVGASVDEGVTLSGKDRVLLIVAMACVGAICVGALAYLSILMTTNGYDEGFAAAMLSLFGICLTASKLGAGIAFDRFGTVRGTVLVFGAAVIGMALCCLTPLHLMTVAVAAAVFFGLGTSLGSTCISVWSLKLSKPSTRARTVRDFQVGYAVGGFIGDTFPGFLAEACGSYVPTFAIILVTTALAGIIVVTRCRKYLR